MSLAMQTLPQAITLDQLLGRPDVASLPVTGITLDSRQVAAGDVFFACPGLTGHGLLYADAAIKNGCSAIVYDPDGVERPGEFAVPTIAEPGLREHLGIIADRFFQYPSKTISVIGVTGTNGKTTVAWLLAAALRHLGQTTAYSGTLGFGIESVEPADGLTTPNIFDMHRRLADARDQGATAVAQEVSSHALDQGRISEVRFRLAAFTNLSRDHLDYHGSIEEYAAAKRRLFTDYAPRIAVINIDSEAGQQLANSSVAPVVTVSTDPSSNANVVVRQAIPKSGGFDLAIESVYGDGRFDLPLLGAFNVENAVVVLGLLFAHGVSVSDAIVALSNCTPPPGRLETVGNTQPVVVIDYAHTPDALAAALRALRPNTNGRLWCVFGCGGDRDQGKRPLMAEVAERLADEVVITSDNPRNESPSDIVRDVAAGLSNPATLIEDRFAAIQWAVQQASPDDIVLIAGKGHEQVQLVGEQRLPFADADVALAALTARGGAS